MAFKLQGKDVFMVVMGSATKGGKGFGITPNGVVPIPDNNPLHDIAAMGELAITARSAATKRKMEKLIAEQIRILK